MSGPPSPAPWRVVQTGTRDFSFSAGCGHLVRDAAGRPILVMCVGPGLECGRPGDHRLANAEHLTACVNALAARGVDPAALSAEPVPPWAAWALALLRSGGDPGALAGVADAIREFVGDMSPTSCSIPITHLGLSVRAIKACRRLTRGSPEAAWVTAGEVARFTAEEFMDLPNVGITTLTEVREKLARVGLRLRGDRPA